MLMLELGLFTLKFIMNYDPVAEFLKPKDG